MSDLIVQEKKHEHAHDHATAPSQDAADQPSQQMCCDGSGRTVEQHRAESEDGKCCIDG